jgi:hypothetical protein
MCVNLKVGGIHCKEERQSLGVGVTSITLSSHHSPYKLHWEHATNRKYTPHKSNHSTHTTYTLNTHIHRNKKGAYPVLQNQHCCILTPTHSHIHVGKIHRREHGNLLNIPAVTTYTYATHTYIGIIPKFA